MRLLHKILPTILIVLLIIDYLDNLSKKTSIQIVNEMGIGYNLGHSFDNYIYYTEYNNTDEVITLFGNPIPTKNLIINIKKYGFKTIRFPVTWIYFIDQFGNIDPEWILRVKEVVKWIIERDIYCILNVYTDTKEWITGIESKNKYINLWKQIAEEFKDFNEYLIFESMNEPTFLFLFDYNYDTLLNFTQSFVDTIRNSEKFNKERLLIISGMTSNIEFTCSPGYKIPIDPANKIAISINYYIPVEFATSKTYWFNDKQFWGSIDDYKELLKNFVTLKDIFISKGIPVVIGEVGVVTESTKELSSIREYLCSVFSLSVEYEGIMACLWDTSNKDYGDMNYYNRLTDEWYDNKIKNILMKISKGNIVKSNDYYIFTNIETIIYTKHDYYYNIVFGTKKPLKMIINTCCGGNLYYDYYFEIYCFDRDRWRHNIFFDESNGRRYYDGTFAFTIDLRKEECYEYFEIYSNFGKIYFKNITIEYQENFTSFYYNDYKAKIINEIN
jgi:endoglucanase